MKYNEYADQLNRHSLIKKAKEVDYKSFLSYCSGELKRVSKMRLPTKIERRNELLSLKDSYYNCLLLVNYIVGTGDTKPSGDVIGRKIAKAIVEHYEKEGYLSPGTTDKFEF